MRGRGPRYRVDWAPEAWTEVHALKLRIRSKHRLLYGIYRVVDDEKEPQIVEILRAIIKETDTTEQALRRER